MSRQRYAHMFSTRRARRADGFSLIEVMIVSAMTAFLAVLISGISAALTRSAADTADQARVVCSARMALESLRRDLAGNAPEQQLGTKFEGEFVGRLVTSDDRLMLCFDGGDVNETADWASPDTVIVYELQDDQLLRSNQNTGASYVVAENISDFRLTDLPDGVRVDFTVARAGFTRAYTLISEDP